MIKLLPVFLLLLFFQNMYAQNYECIKPKEKQYFVADNGYLRGMRIDTTRISGDTTFYYPYHSPRGKWNNLDLNGASWFGAEIIEMKDGVYWFFNNWKDTVEIRTQAKLNDKWVCFHDTNDIYYEAQVTAIDTATIKGTVDSIKILTISAYDKNGIIATAIAHGLEYVISKNHGFYKTRDLYFFPYHHPGDDSGWVYLHEDYFTYEVGGFGQFEQFDFKNPRLNEIYGYQVGDIFFILDKPGIGLSGYDIYFYDSVAVAKSISGGKEYEIHRKAYYPVYKNYPYNLSTYEVRYGGYKIVADSTPLFQWFPEETSNPEIYYVYNEDTTYCSSAVKYKTRNSLIVGNAVSQFEVMIEEMLFKTHIGNVYHSKQRALAIRFENYVREMNYYRLGGKDCGSYLFPTTINSTSLSKEITIYPSPAVGNLVYIDIPKETNKACLLTVYDAIGKQRLIKKVDTHTAVDISALPSGVYLFVVTTDDEKTIKRVTVP